MNELNFENHNNIQLLINEYYSKHKNDKFDLSKFKQFLVEKNNSFNAIFIQLIEEIKTILENLCNSITQENFKLIKDKEDILNKLIEIISALNLNVELNKEQNKIILDNFYTIYIFIFNSFIKISDLVEKEIYIKDNNIKYLIDKLIEQMTKLIEIIYNRDKNSIENSLAKPSSYDMLIKQPLTRNILYDILLIIISNEKNIKSPDGKLLEHKGSLKLINNIIEYLIKEMNENNINDNIQDIKTIITIYKDNLELIELNILKMLKKFIEFYNSESQMKSSYEKLFSFFFNNIIFIENSQNKYNKKFIEILFELYKYYLEQKNKQFADLFLIQLFSSVSYYFENNGITKRPLSYGYEWLLKETSYKKVILESLPIIFDESIFSYYLGALIYLMNPPENQKRFLPEKDLIIFFKNFEKYLSNQNFDKEKLISFFRKKICDLMSINAKVCKIVLQKCNIFKIIMKIINTEKENNIKIKLIELMEKIIEKNQDDYEYSFEIDLRKDMDDEINYRINLFTVGYEFKNNKFNKKIGDLINILTEHSKNKKISDFIKVSNFIFKIIREYQFKKIDEITEENLLNFNNLLLQISMTLSNSDSDDLEKFIENFLDLIFKFIIQLNLTIFDYKIKKKLSNKRFLYYSKRIIKKKIIKNIIKNLLLSQNHIVTKKTYEFLKLISIDEKNNLIKSSYIIYIVTKIYYQEKNYKRLKKIFDTLLNMVKNFPINAQILLYNDFLTIILNILQELYGKENEYEEYYKSTFSFLVEISKYLNQNLLMIYLNKIFSFFKKNVLNEIQEEDRSGIFQMGQREIFDETNNDKEERTINLQNDDIFNSIKEDEEEIDEEKDKFRYAKLEEENTIKKPFNKLCLDLLGILENILKKNYIKENKLILSNYTFPNHLINNILYIDNLKLANAPHDTYIGLKLIIKINSYKGINGFILLKLIREKQSINFIIKNNTLEIIEYSENKEKILNKIDNFDKICPEGLYHNIILNFETKQKTFEMKIDNKIIINKSNPYKDFIFNNLSVIIGFNIDLVNESNNFNYLTSNFVSNSEQKNNYILKAEEVCFINISYLLIVNTLLEDESLSLMIKKEESKSTSQALLNHLYNIGNENYGKNVITEIDFNTKNMNLSYAQSIYNKETSIKDFLISGKSLFINRYLSCKILVNNFNAENPYAYMYMISKNNNINEFCALNEIWELEKINKLNISYKLFDNFDIKDNLIQPYIIDFLFGFFFLIERRYSEIKYKFKENEKVTDEQIKEHNDNNEIYFTNEDILMDYFLVIFKIIFSFPKKELEEYFSENNILKLKFCFYRNINLIKTDDDFIIKILDIFSENQILFLEFISEIFFDINIFDKLDSLVQNTIIDYLIKYFESIEFNQENNYHKDIYDCIISLINSILNIILFIVIQTDSFIKVINIIMQKLTKVKIVKNNNKLQKIFYEMNNICSNFKPKKEEHINEEIYEKYNYIFFDEEDFIEGYLEKINNLSEQINNYFNLTKKNKDIISLINKYNIDKKNGETYCSFCTYLKKLFYAKSKFIYDEYSYTKTYKRFFRNYYQNFGDNSDIFKKNDYVWFLSLKESGGKMQNKMFLKENLIKDYIYISSNTNKETRFFKYIINKQKYKQKFKELHKLYFYDQICKHDCLIKGINRDLDLKPIYYYNCLIINKLHKTLSVLVLYEDHIIIYTYICLDTNNKIHIVFNETTPKIMWMKTGDEFNKELNDYINGNEIKIKDEIYDNKVKNNNIKANLSNFNYNKNYKFAKRIIIPLKKINEIHKKDYLHIPNSLEIFLNNGENYFFVFNPDIRETIFDKIISAIDDIYKSSQQNQIPIFKSTKLQSLINRENLFYMKHTPLVFLSQSETDHFLKNYYSKNGPTKKMNIKSILDGNSFKEEICNYWAKNKISNYDYIMLLNTLAGRTLNDLSQYFIFPWIIQDFDKEFLNWLSNSIYRDLSVPIYACGGDSEKFKRKYELLDDEKYHSGTFYSAHTFVCYFLIRLHPFTEIHLEIQGARFDEKARMFNGVKQLSEIKEKFQEFIPQLFYCPEMFIKLNYILEDINLDEEIMSDFQLPSWSKDDPRKFSLILRKLLENEKVSEKLNHWIDLIFGYQQKGSYAEKALNTYRNCVYYPSKAELEEMESCEELESYFFEKEELGCISKQLFKSKHKSKENISENNKFKNVFFNTKEKLNQLTFQKIKEESKLKKKLYFEKYNDIIFQEHLKSKSYYQGGISSLSSFMNIKLEQTSSKINKEKIIQSLDKEEIFFILKKNYFFLRKYSLILAYNNKFIEIIDIKEEVSKFYLLLENEEISCITTNSKGDKIFVGFSNGFINQYKIILKPLDEVIDKNLYIQKKFEYQSNEQNNKIFYKTYIDKFLFNRDYFKKEKKYDYNICLELINKNNFNNNNPHFYRRINLLGLNETHNILIALDQANIIYTISLNNNFKLMHKITFLSKTQIKIKEIIPLHQNGDFIIYSSYSVNLFSINGVPLCSLNLFEKEYKDYYSITCCRAVFIYEVTLFTAHKDGSIIIWKIINKDIKENFDNKTDKFLKEYKYGYNYRNYMNSGIKLKEFELRRKFEQIGIGTISKEKKNKSTQHYCTFMKMSSDMSYMILLDNDKNIYIMNNIDIPEKRKFSFFTKSRQKCMHCGKELKDFAIRPTLVPSMSSDLSNIPTQKSNNSKNNICEDCMEMLQHTENYLYSY